MSNQQTDEPHIILVEPKADPWKENVYPVTIFQIHEANSLAHRHGSNTPYLMIGKRQVGLVTLVAHLIHVEIMPAKAIYVLEDGTGRLQAEKTLDSLHFYHGESEEAEEEEKTQYSSIEHTYVEITCSLSRENFNKLRIKLLSLHPVNGFNHVMYHMLHVMYAQKCVQQCHGDSDENFGLVDSYIPEDDDIAACQPELEDDSGFWKHEVVTLTPPASHPIPPNSFTPQRHHPYATLEPLERAIMKYMRNHRQDHVLISELTQAVCASSECSQGRFSYAFQALLSEGYITSPLDDGHVVITPRH